MNIFLGGIGTVTIFLLQRRHIEIIRLALLHGIGQLFSELTAGSEDVFCGVTLRFNGLADLLTQAFK